MNNAASAGQGSKDCNLFIFAARGGLETAGPLGGLRMLGPLTTLSFAQKKRTPVTYGGERGNKSIQGVGDVQTKKGAERGNLKCRRRQI
jgi:hypothetical protein